ncbi:MAG TPA: hypothetical protein VE135_08205 [Pyrinomonadaceae bacterium]|nr:hypothetical protein [Pyrinomonadaceae bacterium]
MKRQNTIQSLLVTLVICLPMPATSGCGGHRVPDLARVFSDARKETGKRPIILIPGVLNTALVNAKTGETVWPSAFRSDYDDLNLPITDDPLKASDNLIATKAIETVRFLPLTPRVNILRDLLVALRSHVGYKEGDWENPPPDGDRDTFYTFTYDWRRDNVQLAQQLIEQTVALKKKLSRPDLRFNIVAVSMGGLIARYAAMYGNADLTPENVPPQVTWAGAVHFEKILMFAVPNGGSMEAFATILNGYSYTEGPSKHRHLLNKLSREDAFSGPAIFQLMPHRQSVRFLDQDLRPLQVDLYDPANWKLYGWSVANDPEFRSRFAVEEANDRVGNHSGVSVLDIHLAILLERSRLFHRALDVVSEAPAPVELLAFIGDCDDTLDAAILYRDKKTHRWVTMTAPEELRSSSGRKIPRKDVINAMYVPGDGRVTRSSVLAENLGGAASSQSPYRTILPIVHAFFGCGGHGDLHNSKIMQNNALSLLVYQVMK